MRPPENTEAARTAGGDHPGVADGSPCINAEATLAIELAPTMRRPREAKQLLRNFFSASGDLRVTDNSIEVVLDVAGTSNEHHALAALCRTVTAWKLTHPGDAAGRPLRFRTHIS